MQETRNNVSESAITGIEAVSDRNLRSELEYVSNQGNSVEVTSVNSFTIIFKTKELDNLALSPFYRYGFSVRSIKVLQFTTIDFALLVVFRR